MRNFLIGVVVSVLALLAYIFVPKIHLPEYDKCQSTHLKFDYYLGESILADGRHDQAAYDKYQFFTAREVLGTPICYSYELIDTSKGVYDSHFLKVVPQTPGG